MQTTRMFLPVNQSGADLLVMLAKATEEGKAASADLCSARLDKLAAYAANPLAQSPRFLSPYGGAGKAPAAAEARSHRPSHYGLWPRRYPRR